MQFTSRRGDADELVSMQYMQSCSSSSALYYCILYCSELAELMSMLICVYYV